ncbi:MAG TPA: glycerophosphodiester phosphodiesterase family protein, partial [Candidatus Polarisedimenticolaceae bacterium]|nr:glycerophosphodiester phosphodiesterase family protein [Candidatus Polarisedimenticolaceae bacterium]
DTDILRFFVATKSGLASLLVLAAVLTGLTVLELACLMPIGLAAAEGRRLPARTALYRAALRVPELLALAAHMVVRVAAALIPFLLGGLLLYVGLLRGLDINYYLAARPPAFWAAAILGGALLAGLVVALLWAVARWTFALPLLLFERVPPRRALGESARRSAGHRWRILGVLAAWAGAAAAILTLATWAPHVAGRTLAPHFAASMPLLLTFMVVLGSFWGLLVLAAGIFNVALFSLLVNRLYLGLGSPKENGERTRPDPKEWSPPPRMQIAVVLVAVLGVAGAVFLAASIVRHGRKVEVIAHRGASVEAPENTLAAFRLAVEQGADFVELDVQESADGEVVVVHDSDLMKIGGSPLKPWEATAAELRSVDIGSHAGPQFASERVPTLAEALAVAKGRAKVIVELKSYGHDQHLEERVAAIVEAAGMQDECIYMSLDHAMAARMKALRPGWRCGLLAAQTVGDLVSRPADFLAVRTAMATPGFVRRAHAAGRDVYVWTVNDPAAMLGAMSRGVDGLITDRPDLAKKVVARRAAMNDAQRVLVALLVRLGADTQRLVAEESLRP